MQSRQTLVVGLILIAACGGSESTAPPLPVATTITLSASSLAFVSLGETQQVTATVLDQNGAAMVGVLLGWSSSNEQVVTVSSTGLVTATGNGSGTITARAGSATRSSSALVADPDLDDDGFLNADDDCPNQPETLNDWLDDDGCPDETTELYNFVRSDVEAYWQAVFDASALTYDSIAVFQPYDAEFQSPCGVIPLNNAAYCPLNFGVYYHRAFMDGYLSDPGDMAPAFIVSHEIGHHITFLLRYFKPFWSAEFPSISHFLISDKQSELMADCFGGAWVNWADQRGWLDEGDGEELVKTLISIGDTTIPWFSPEGHGTAEQRLLALLIGVVNGPSGCLDPDFFVIFPTEGPAQQMAPPPNPLGSRRIMAGR